MTATLSLPPLSQKQTWGNLPGASLALTLANVCLQQPGIKLIVVPDNLAVYQLQEEIKFFNHALECIVFPDWETLPYDQFSPHQDIISERLSALSKLLTAKDLIVIVAAPTLMHQLCPPSFLQENVFMLDEGQTLDVERFKLQLVQAGYYAVNKVLEHGEFAVRGSIIDLYPMGAFKPYRLDLLDSDIDSIRIFDPETQRTIEKIKCINILPAREFPLNDTSVALFRQSFREQFSGNPSLCSVYEAISDKRYAPGIEYYLPFFFEKTATLFDYLPSNALLCVVGTIQDTAELFHQELIHRHEERNHDITRPLLKPSQLFLTPVELMTRVNQFQHIRLFSEKQERKGVVHNFNSGIAPKLPIDRKTQTPLLALVNYVQQSNIANLLVVESRGRREVILDLLKQHDITPTIVESFHDFLANPTPLALTIGTLIDGAEIPELNCNIIVESQLFGDISPIRRTQQKIVDPDVIIRDLAEITIGSPVVHLNFGVGRYEGLKTIDNQGTLNEFLILAYAGDDKIYVPVTNLQLISRYTGNENPPLHKLGGDQWQKEKKKAAEIVHDVAIELLDIYAQRRANPRPAYEFNKADYQRFASNFPFIETQDQLIAIDAIIDDLRSDDPMDRLICGDVGFGKTEVAMRAAFLAVQNNKQVCILVPTTLLAGQHYENFKDRFADFPINIDLLSRFKSTKEANQVIAALGQGRVDIIIGTHKLFSKDIVFKNLGLLIIDEEHRFGVKQKEHIKALRTHVDVLSMTATPIPRTLNMAMSGIRDISLIATPPQKRLAVKTFWQERNTATMREAVLREISRGGQVFFLHNNVDTIQRIVEELQALVPEAKIQMAHGQMRERDLERVMSDFYHHRFNVLVCTTIIETGIDIPTANTIIMDRADKFGLAQLHQLRGRVGRSHHQAYAYLLTPPEKSLTSDARKRLEALMSLEDLGSGFTLATHDLEIRGAGELLGEGQSGNMHAVGFSLFMEMLDKAVNALKSGKIPELMNPIHQGPEIDLSLSTVIPEDYIGDIHTRLVMYKRIASAKDKATLHERQIELIDRFGLLPDSVKHLLLVTELKYLAEAMGIVKIRASSEECKIEFNDNPAINSAELIRLIQVHAARYKLDGKNKLKFTLEAKTPADRIHEIMRVMHSLR